MKNTNDIMPLDLFEKCIKKGVTEGFKLVGLYNWTEPFLNNNFDKYITIVKKNGLVCDVSSNLSLNPDKYFPIIEKSLSAGIDNFFVSVSGYDEDVYTINHRGGNIHFVKENLEKISKLKENGAIESKIFLKFIKFYYNGGEEEKLRQYAEKLGLNFVMINGGGQPVIPSNGNEEDKNGEKINGLKEHEDNYKLILSKYNSERPFDKQGICNLIGDSVNIDCHGDVYLCCLHPNYNFLKIGKYLEMNIEDIFFKRYIHPFCSTCGWERRIVNKNDVEKLKNGLLNCLGIEEEIISKIGMPEESSSRPKYKIRKMIDRVLVQMYGPVK